MTAPTRVLTSVALAACARDGGGRTSAAVA